MKRLLLLLPLLFIAGCGKYGSWEEASSACNSWRFEKGRFEIATQVQSNVLKTAIRRCSDDNATRQVLGYEYSKAEASTTYIGDSKGFFTNENGKALGPSMVTKKFKY